ncbi:hypothetical protein [Amycolatopsis sp. NPDC102389]|uniref:NucA/NucB deoxyribonuclease domain-containing protein n=1 Tax=Amycolatopsis sp. NPDC102389 TaxID=3363941 RepID=UPI0037FA847E
MVIATLRGCAGEKSEGKIIVLKRVTVTGALVVTLGLASSLAAAADRPATPADSRDHATIDVVIDEPTWAKLHDPQRRVPAPVPPLPQVPPNREHARPGVLPQFGRAEAEDTARRNAASHDQRSMLPAQGGGAPAGVPTTYGPVPIGDEPHPVSKDCLAGDGAESGFGRIHDRFNYCQRAEVEMRFFRRLPVLGRTYVGSNYFTYEIYGQGDNLQRRARTFAHVIPDSVKYRNWSLLDLVLVAPNINLTIDLNCVDTGCNSTPGPVTMSFTAWDHSTRWYYWDLYNNEGSAPSRDKVSYGRFALSALVSGEGFVPTKTYTSDARMVRCDSADYFGKGTARYPKACIFNEVIPHLTYQQVGPHASVAAHIKTAQDTPNAVWPKLAPAGQPEPRDKRIPGKYISGDWRAAGLHRVEGDDSDPNYKENGKVKDGACYLDGPYKEVFALTGLPSPGGPGRPDTTVQDCDEYPFASTREGAADNYWTQGTHRWDFSVRAVPLGENRSAGTALKNYYVDDRMLRYDAQYAEPENDRFYVAIK